MRRAAVQLPYHRGCIRLHSIGKFEVPNVGHTQHTQDCLLHVDSCERPASRASGRLLLTVTTPPGP